MESQISKALLGEDQKLRLPRFLEEQTIDPGKCLAVIQAVDNVRCLEYSILIVDFLYLSFLEVSKQNLADQIAQLNSTIDNIHQSLNPPIVDKEEVPAQS